MIPKKATGAPRKYNFEEMKPKVDWIPAGDYSHARSIQICAFNRNYNACIRTVNGEIRVYLVGRKNNGK